MNRVYNFLDVIARAKESFGCKKDKEFAKILGISPQTFGNRKKTESIPYDEIISVAIEKGADIQYILTGKPFSSKKPENIDQHQELVSKVFESVAELELPIKSETTAELAENLYERIATRGFHTAVDLVSYAVLRPDQKALLENLEHCPPGVQDAIKRLAFVSASVGGDGKKKQNN